MVLGWGLSQHSGRDSQLHDLHSHPAADAALERQTYVSQAVTLSSGQQRSSGVVAAHAEGFGTGRRCCPVHLQRSHLQQYQRNSTEPRQPGAHLPTACNVHC